MSSIQALLGGDSDESDESDEVEKIPTPRTEAEDTAPNSGKRNDECKVKTLGRQQKAESDDEAPSKRRRTHAPSQNTETLYKKLRSTTEHQQLSQSKRFAKQDPREERHNDSERKLGHGADVSSDRDQRGDRPSDRDRDNSNGADKRAKRPRSREKMGELPSARERKSRHDREYPSFSGGDDRERGRDRTRNRENRSTRERSRERGTERDVGSSRGIERNIVRRNREPHDRFDDKGARDQGSAPSSTGPVAAIGRAKENKLKTIRDRDKPRGSRDRKSANQHEEASGKRERDAGATNRTKETSDHAKWTSDREKPHNSRDRSNRGSDHSRLLGRATDARDDKKGNAHVERIEMSAGTNAKYEKTINDNTRGSRDSSSRSSNWDKTSQDVNARVRNTKAVEQSKKSNEGGFADSRGRHLPQKIDKKQGHTSKSVVLISEKAKNMKYHVHEQRSLNSAKPRSRSPVRRVRPFKQTRHSLDTQRHIPNQQARLQQPKLSQFLFLLIELRLLVSVLFPSISVQTPCRKVSQKWSSIRMIVTPYATKQYLASPLVYWPQVTI